MKKKILALVLVIVLAITAVTGATLAYFVDTHTQTNTFTAGKVDIALDEAIVEKDEKGNLVAIKEAENGKLRTDEGQSYKLFPGMTVTKDPTITVASDSEDSYIAAKITIKCKDLWDLYGVWTEDQGDKYWNIDINKFVSGGLIQVNAEQTWNWNGLSMVYIDSNKNVYYQDAKNGEWVIYVFIKDIKKANDKIVLFNTVTVDKDFGNDKMAILNGMTVEVKAFAVQAYGFETDATDAYDCFNAMTTAFAAEFNFA